MVIMSHQTHTHTQLKAQAKARKLELQTRTRAITTEVKKVVSTNWSHFKGHVTKKLNTLQQESEARLDRLDVDVERMVSASKEWKKEQKETNKVTRDALKKMAAQLDSISTKLDSLPSAVPAKKKKKSLPVKRKKKCGKKKECPKEEEKALFRGEQSTSPRRCCSCTAGHTSGYASTYTCSSKLVGGPPCQQQFCGQY